MLHGSWLATCAWLDVPTGRNLPRGRSLFSPVALRGLSAKPSNQNKYGSLFADVEFVFAWSTWDRVEVCPSALLICRLSDPSGQARECDTRLADVWRCPRKIGMER